MNEIEILIVEDNPDDLDMALLALKKGKIANHIQVARDGAEALDFVFCEGAFSGRMMKDGPKGILLDLKLPKLDGLEVLRRIRSSETTHMLPVVVLTSSDEERDVIRSYQLGVNSYIRKPVNFNDFAEATRQLGMYWLVLNECPPTN